MLSSDCLLLRLLLVGLRFLGWLCLEKSSGIFPFLFDDRRFQLLELFFANAQDFLDVPIEGRVIHLDVWLLLLC